MENQTYQTYQTEMGKFGIPLAGIIQKYSSGKLGILKELVVQLAGEVNTAINHVRSYSELKEVFNQLKEGKFKRIYIGLITIGDDPFVDNLVLINLMVGNQIYLIHFKEINQISKMYGLFSEIFASSDIQKIFHDAKVVMKFLNCNLAGFLADKRKNLIFRNIFDIKIADQLINGGIKSDFSLTGLIKKYLDLEASKQEGLIKDNEISKEGFQFAIDYVFALRSIYHIQVQELDRSRLTKVAILEFGIVSVIASMELDGILIDKKRLQENLGLLKEEQNNLKETLNAYTTEDINWGSFGEVIKVLKQNGIHVKRTDKDELKKFKVPLTKTLLKYRSVSSKIDNFGKWDKYIHPNTGRIHAVFNQLKAGTGRMSTSNPNVQGLPKEKMWREIVTAPKGYKIIAADYSQIELRILAFYTEDSAFKKIFENDEDLHSKTAATMFQMPIDQITDKERKIAKVINFGLCYGMGVPALSTVCDISGKKAAEFLNLYRQAYPKEMETLDELSKKAVDYQYAETLSGRKRYLNGSSNLARAGRNTPIQGSCADILKTALFYINEDAVFQESGAKIINVVHDEIVVEVIDDYVDQIETIVNDQMVKAGNEYIAPVPVKVDVAVSRKWG